MLDPILTAINYNDFKRFFYRDGFSFIPQDEWNESINYVIGNSVYDRNTKKIYTALQDNTNVSPSLDGTIWKAETIDVFQYVLPEDVERGFEEAFAFGRFKPIIEDNIRKQAFLYASAHFTAKRINEQNDKNFTPHVSSMSVGGVSENYVIPDWLQTEGNIIFTSTMFGIQYKLLLKRYTGFAFTYVAGKVNVL